MSKKEQYYEQVCIALAHTPLQLGSSMQEATHHASVSIQHMRRIFAKYQLGGAHALCHASRHRPGRPQYLPTS